MVLTSDDKLDMSLDDIIRLDRRRYQIQRGPRRWGWTNFRQNQYRFRPSYWPRTNRRTNQFANPMRRRYPLMLYTQKWRQYHAYKSIKRAKYFLQNQRNRAYNRWENLSCNSGDVDSYSQRNDWDDNASNWSMLSHSTNQQAYRRKRWANQENVDSDCPNMLTVSLRNNLVPRSRLGRTKLPPQPLMLTRQSPSLATRKLQSATVKSKGIESLHPVVGFTNKTLNERFSLNLHAQEVFLV